MAFSLVTLDHWQPWPASLGPQSVRQCLDTEQRTQQASLYELLPHVDNAITVVRRAGPHLVAYQRGQSSGGEVPEGAALPPGRVQRSEFTSNKLAPKLAQQLKVCADEDNSANALSSP